eukprot:gb/GECG01016838.1/.p1 GENE.gb/GECG01016838.1/~~gb/GECG01016838.1/.p1  ORF type:complete len:982 (+),score=90.90 gb/GECG01016838.1/:1-2946(+)
MDKDCPNESQMTVSNCPSEVIHQDGVVGDNLQCGPVSGGGGRGVGSPYSAYQTQAHRSGECTDINNSDVTITEKEERAWPLLNFCTRKASYPLIARIAPFLGWKLTSPKNADIAWMDVWTSMDLQRVEIKINHFSGMYQICAKCSLGRHLTRMKKVSSNEFSFFPPTFVLPADRASLQRYLENGDLSGKSGKALVTPKHTQTGTHKLNGERPPTDSPVHSIPAVGKSVGESDVYCHGEADGDCSSTPVSKDSQSKVFFPQGEDDSPSAADLGTQKRRRKVPKHVFISKPDSSSQGQGIQLVTNPSRLLSFGTTLDSVDKPSKLVQKYIDNPVLIGGHKFDLRLYACVSAVQPEPRVFLLSEGLARFATKPYKRPTTKNSKNRMMHLTNYAVNKGQELHLNLQGDCDRDLDNESPSYVTESTASVADGSPVPDADYQSSGNELDAANDEIEVDEQLTRLFNEALGNQLETPEGVIVDPFAGFREHPVLMSTDECGSGGPKWSLSAVMSVLREQKGIDVDQLWSETCDVVAKTVASIAPTLRHHYAAATVGTRNRGDKVAENRKNGSLPGKQAHKSFDAESEGFMCFEVLGFDIMFARDRASKSVKPQLIEVNQSPSFHSDSVLDAIVKLLAVGDALRLGAASEQWLKKSFAPMISRSPSVRGRVDHYSVKELRALYEDVICYGDLFNAFGTRDQAWGYKTDCRYVRLMPADDQRKQEQYDHLMEQASYASGSVLQGGSEALNRRREEALERRKQLAKEHSLKLPKVSRRSRSSSHRSLHGVSSRSHLETRRTGEHATTYLRSISCRSLPADSPQRKLKGMYEGNPYPKDDTCTASAHHQEKPRGATYRPPKSAASNSPPQDGPRAQTRRHEVPRKTYPSESRWVVAMPTTRGPAYSDESVGELSEETSCWQSLPSTSYSSMLSSTKSLLPDAPNFHFCSHGDHTYRKTYAKERNRPSASSNASSARPLEISGCALKPGVSLK